MLLFETLLLAKFLESCVTDVGQLLKSLDILVSQVTELFKPGHELPHGFRILYDDRHGELAVFHLIERGEVRLDSQAGHLDTFVGLTAPAGDAGIVNM